MKKSFLALVIGLAFVSAISCTKKEEAPAAAPAAEAPAAAPAEAQPASSPAAQ